MMDLEMSRDPSLLKLNLHMHTQLYYAKLPKDIESRYVLLLDPMLGK
jgi:uracil phosphoribosyltransferase